MKTQNPQLLKGRQTSSMTSFFPHSIFNLPGIAQFNNDKLNTLCVTEQEVYNININKATGLEQKKKNNKVSPVRRQKFTESTIGKLPQELQPKAISYKDYENQYFFLGKGQCFLKFSQVQVIQE